MQEIINLLPPHLKIGFLSSLVSAFLIILAGVFLYKYYREFFIGENPKEWKLASLGLVLYGIFVPLDMAIASNFPENYMFILSVLQLIGPLVILIGFLKAFRCYKEEI